MERYLVVFRGEVVGPTDDLHDIGAGIVDALDEAPVEEPFVHTDASTGHLRVEVVALAHDQPEALMVGIDAVLTALRSVGLVDERAVQAPSAQASELAGV